MEEKIDIKNIKETDVLFLKAIQDVVKSLKIIEELIETNGPRQSQTDSLLSDYEHLLEESKTRNKSLSDTAYIKIAKEIEKQRDIRRHQKNEFELERIYMQQNEKLFHKEHRTFFTNEIYRRFTELNQPYKPRILTDKQIEELLAITVEESKKTRKTNREKNNEIINQKIKEMLEQGYSQKKIAVELKMSQPSICLRIKKMKELQEV